MTELPAVDVTDASGPATRRPGSAQTVLVLGLLTCFGPLSLDLYLPAFPLIAKDFHSTASQVQLTLTACLVGLALGQLVVGPMSDRFGRKPPLLVGLVGYALASLACTIAPDIGWLTAARLAQGLAGSAGIVSARAIARDLHTGPALARLFSLLILVTGLAPVLGPTAGAQVLRFTSWHGMFVVLAAVGVALAVMVVLVLPETLPPERRHPGGIASTLRTFGRLLREREFVGYALTTGFVLGAMFSYIAGSSFVLQEVYDLSPQEYAFAFGANAVGLIVMSQVSARLVHALSARVLLRAGVLLSLVGGTSLLLSVLADAGLAAVLVSLFVLVLSVGVVSPNATALALADHPAVAGSASALLGLSQYAFGCVLAPMTGLDGQTSFAWVIAGSALTAAAVHTVLLRQRRAS